METAPLEKEIVEELFRLRGLLRELELEHERIEKEIKEKTDKLISFLNNSGKSSTGMIRGIGEISLRKATKYASYKQENLAEVKNYLKSIAREDIIKETINPKALAEAISSAIEKTPSTHIPQCINLYALVGLNYREWKGD
jgi:hypothetical protein